MKPVRSAWRWIKERIRQAPDTPPLITAGFVLILLALYALVLWKLFDRYAHPTTFADRKDLLGTLATFLAGSLALLGIYPAWRTFRINQEGQITTRFTQAVEQLGNEKREVRLGGIYALERIARDSDKDYQQIIEVLAAYVRENAPQTHIVPRLFGDRKRVPPARIRDARRPRGIALPKEDVQAVLNVLQRRRFAHGNGESFQINLSRTELQGADIGEIHLEGALLFDTDLSRADLRGADLRGANLTGADLRKADLTDADLSRARLLLTLLRQAFMAKARLMYAYMVEADLARADLVEADLTGADLTNAHMSGARLSGARLPGAFLRGANLARADLTGANLAGARLILSLLPGAVLSEADLTGSHLRGADLTDAVLAKADLSGADLAGANLAGARLQDTTFGPGDLREVRGLIWEQIAVARFLDGKGMYFWQDGAGDRAALRRMLPDYVIVPDEPAVATAGPAADAPDSVDASGASSGPVTDD